MKIPRILISAPSSGSGKTVISCAIMQALTMKGYRVAACKCGPDYIDPMFHREVLGVDSENLDLFFTEGEDLQEVFASHAGNKDIAVVEGVMGFYDGMALDSWRASSYDVARTLQAPVILVLSARGMALSAAAVIEGIARFRKDSNIRGILLNRITAGIYPRMKDMLEKELAKRGLSIPVLGYVPEDEAFSLESRHLGLVTPAELKGLKEEMARAGELLLETVDLETLCAVAAQAPEIPAPEKSPEALEIPVSGKSSQESETPVQEKFLQEGDEKILQEKRAPLVAVARDEAFCFYYKENLRLLEELGCELRYFSPLHDRELPANAQGLILGGGYPELYVEALSENVSMRRSIKEAVQSGIPCLAECGGFLYLQEELKDREDRAWRMAGVIKGSAASKGRLARFGYVKIEGKKDGLYLKKDENIRGHEFHYWDSTDNGADCVAVKPDGRRSWECVHMDGRLFAGFPHLYLPSNRKFAERFVEQCMKMGG